MRNAPATAAVALASIILFSCGQTPAPESPDYQIFDGHDDVVGQYIEADPQWSLDTRDILHELPGQADIPRWRKGGFGGSMITMDGGAAPGDKQRFPQMGRAFDWFDALVARYPHEISRAEGPADVRRAMAQHHLALAMAIEGGDELDGSLDNLRTAYSRGVRMLLIVYDHNNEIGDGAMAFVESAAIAAPHHGGLTDYGRTLIREMNDMGMIVDLSHASSETALQAIEQSRAPVVFSHSGVRAMADTPRNVPDEVLRKLHDNGGIVMISFVPYLTTTQNWKWFDAGEREYARLTALHGQDKAATKAGIEMWEAANPQPRVTLLDVADQIEYAARIVGRDHVGIGTDFDGMGEYTISALKDAAAAPALFVELARRGWSLAELRGLASANFLAVWDRVELAARRAK